MASSTQVPATMRAAQWRTTTGSIEKNLKLVTNAPLPKTASSLPKGCILVKVAYASINHDYKLAELPIVNRIFPNPATPGVDYSGTVVATTLSTLQPDQRVFGRTEMHKCGTLAELFGGGRRRFKFHSVFANPEHFLRVGRWIEEGKVKPVIEDVFGLEDAGKAYARIKSGQAAGKLVIAIGGDGVTVM
ncbi:Zinc-type alcohol dehydrogenase-like protein [Colletotrichum sp. SAR 10_70]|nr:Zinc-type alcohol dehydrogenase-like protein [Colletotrichum sp. SAR 10_70]KAI8236280.1 Zinc-type alcohol dehydrogenase-like protein [Colletotrichum sp. SAR 10_86]